MLQWTPPASCRDRLWARSPALTRWVTARLQDAMALGLVCIIIATASVVAGSLVGCAQLLGLDNFTDQEDQDDGKGGSSNSARTNLARATLSGSSEGLPAAATERTAPSPPSFRWHVGSKASSEIDAGADASTDGGVASNLDAARYR